jgi:hypothetical protein
VTIATRNTATKIAVPGKGERVCERERRRDEKRGKRK